jgi:hypothetical protein
LDGHRWSSLYNGKFLPLHVNSEWFILGQSSEIHIKIWGAVAEWEEPCSDRWFMKHRNPPLDCSDFCMSLVVEACSSFVLVRITWTSLTTSNASLHDESNARCTPVIFVSPFSFRTAMSSCGVDVEILVPLAWKNSSVCPRRLGFFYGQLIVTLITQKARSMFVLAVSKC